MADLDNESNINSSDIPNNYNIRQIKAKLKSLSEIGGDYSQLVTDVENLTIQVNAIEDSIKDHAVYAGYGGIIQKTATPISDLIAGESQWVTVSTFDTNLISNPKEMITDFTNNNIIFTKRGIWSMTARISLEFASVNLGRKLGLRLYNLTRNEEGTAFMQGVGIAMEVSSLSVIVLTEITEDHLGDVFVLQIGGGSEFTAINSLNALLQATHVSESIYVE